MKGAWGAFFYYGGFFHLIRLWNNLCGRRLTILTYHRVGNQTIANLKESLPFLFVSEANFEKHLEFIKKWFHVIGFEELGQYQKAGTLPRNSLIITFDDGYEDNYSIAYKMLKKHDLKACFFIPANRVGAQRGKAFWWDRAFSILQKGLEPSREERDSKRENFLSLYQKLGDHFFTELNTWDTRKIEEDLDAIQGKETSGGGLAENRLLNWTQIQEMEREMEFGSHTCNHFNLCTLPEEGVEREIMDSRMILQDKVGKGILAFSYPQGNTNEKIERIVKGSGYKFAVSTQKGVNSLKEPFALRRINIWEGTAAGANGRFSKGLFAFKIMGY